MVKPNYTGTINDKGILDFCKNNILIEAEFDPKRIKQACYELRASSIYYDLDSPDTKIDIVEDRFDYILIKPKHSVVIITKEVLNLPNYVIGRVLSKGKLFSIGLLPINTYADPGFKGNLGIVFYNTSVNYLKIKEEEVIAKIEFSILKNDVEKPYSGQHGYETKIWPIPKEFILKPDELLRDSRVDSTPKEMIRMFGKKNTGVIDRLLNVEKTLLFAGIAYFTFSIILVSILIHFGKEGWFSYIWSVVLGLISNILSFLFINKQFRK